MANFCLKSTTPKKDDLPIIVRCKWDTFLGTLVGILITKKNDMYDTVNFWLEISTVGFWSADYYLSDIVRGYDGIRGDTLTGKIGNYTALLTERGLSLKGSLSKFYHGGSNVNTLTRESTREAIERLSDAQQQYLLPPRS